MDYDYTEYKEHSGHRWIMLAGGLFWAVALPAAYFLMLKSLLNENIGTIIFVHFAMAILWFASFVLIKTGMSGIMTNGKKHLILYSNSLRLIINDGKIKGKIFEFPYSDVSKFYYISSGTKYDKKTKTYYIKENSCGTINFNIGKDYYCASIYNAMPAAEFIISKITDEQIDESRNELDRNGNHQPKD